MTTLELRITGMTCDHCARSVEEGLNALAGVKASVSFDEGLAKVESTGEVDRSQKLCAQTFNKDVKQLSCCAG